MDLHKHDREHATDHIDRLQDADVSDEFGGRFAARFRSVFSMLQQLRQEVCSRTEVYRVTDPRWQGTAPAGSIKPIIHQAVVIPANRLNDDLDFVCNRPGLYHVSALFAAELAAGSIMHPRLCVLIDGLFYSWLDLQPGSHSHWVLQGSDLVPLACGQRLGLGFSFAAGGNPTISWGSGIVASYGYCGAHWEAPVCGDIDVEASTDTLPGNFGELTAGGS